MRWSKAIAYVLCVTLSVVGCGSIKQPPGDSSSKPKPHRLHFGVAKNDVQVITDRETGEEFLLFYRRVGGYPAAAFVAIPNTNQSK